MGRKTYGQYLCRLAMARMLREFSSMPEERRTDGYAARIIDLWKQATGAWR